MAAERLLVPPLRERPEDIAPLAEQFFIRWALQEDQPRPRLTRNALECLKDHLWPGNLRELYTVLRNTAILAKGNDITADMLRLWLAKAEIVDGAEVPRMTLADMERQLIETTFTRCGGNREKTANSLDIGLRTLSGKLREYGYPPRGGPGSNLKAA
jgi:DNA-binding NtrC family response regulator